MPSLTVYAKQLGPFQPAIDARRAQQPEVIAGQNFLFDVDGPRSAFTTSFANWFHFDDVTRVNCQSFTLNSQQKIYGTPTGLWIIDPVSFIPRLILPVAVVNTHWPWTYAQVGNEHYFAQYNVGLFQLDLSTWTFKTIATPAAVKFICATYGSLVCLSSTTVFWSALDDGTDFTPSLITGAGFQALAILSLNAYRVDPTDDGMIVATDLGFIKGEYVQANFVFRWYVISRDVKIFSPNAGVVIPDVGVLYIDAGGLHSTNGAKPQLWEPEMSDYMKNTFLNDMDKTKFGYVKLTYAAHLKALFVSFASNTREGAYQIAFPYKVVTGKWGEFSFPHSAILELDIPPYRLGVNGYFDNAGYMQYFTELPFTYALPPISYDLADYTWRLFSEPYMTIRDGTFYGSTDMPSSHDDPALWVSATLTALHKISATPNFTTGALDNGAMLVGYVPPQIGANSFVHLGPFRFVEQKEADETSAISTLIIGTSAVASGLVITEDWLVDPGAEDWLDLINPDTFEDWGGDLRAQDSFDLDLMATDDGVNQQIQGLERLLPLENIGAEYQYSPAGFSSIFHRVHISALNPNQSFSIKFVNIAGHITGRHI